jgi:hypothetical protein
MDTSGNGFSNTFDHCDINNKLSMIIHKIDMLQTSVNELNVRFEKVQENCDRMDSHINFVENTYDTLKYPIDIFKNKMIQLFGKGEEKKMLQ